MLEMRLIRGSWAECRISIGQSSIGRRRRRTGCEVGISLDLKARFRAQISRSSRGDEHNTTTGDDEATRKTSLWPPPTTLIQTFENANRFIPHISVASTVLALSYPPSFKWFTPKYYTPTLGYLMFAAGLNLKPDDFLHAVQRPRPVALGYACQYIIKPLLGIIFAYVSVTFLHLPESIGSGLILLCCVSGAQLSNYATYLTEPSMTPLSIVMTALSTATAAFITPSLTYMLLGKRLPVDVLGMMTSIFQVVILPITLGQLLNSYFGRAAKAIRPFLPALSVVATAFCVGSPLATNITALRSTFGLKLLVPVLGIHASAFFLGYKLTRFVFSERLDSEALAKTISLETGMQSSLLGLALANKFFQDPLVGLPSALSVVIMTLMGFTMVEHWNRVK